MLNASFNRSIDLIKIVSKILELDKIWSDNDLTNLSIIYNVFQT